ncbi:hypothetical protein B0H19DRAFT_1380662 [Mycena capillaripes]|nr:hypothetical protein B0H19DRAFT_1380662 [Mycena capillaripes]
MKPEQPGPQTYTLSSSSTIEFQYKWKNVRVNPQNVDADFPFRLELEQNRYSVRFLEFRSFCDPPFDIGNPGDIWLNVSPASYALFALNAHKEWVRWPGPTLDEGKQIMHPYLPIYALWCTVKQASWYHRDKIPKDWTGEKLAARQELGGYSCAESMRDASVGVRLILLQEEMDKTTGEPSASASTPINRRFKSALGELASISTLPETQAALIATLSSGIDYLLKERKKMSRALFEAEERAAIAEQKLAGFSVPNPKYYRAYCYNSPTLEVHGSPTVYTPTQSSQSDREHPPTKSLSSPSNSITPMHLDIFFIPAEDGRSKNCRICLDLVDDELSSLMSHALDAHPDECAVFASASDEDLEVARRELAAAE